MRYFIDKENNIFAYEDNIDSKHIKQGLEEITETQYKSLRLFGVLDKGENDIINKELEGIKNKLKQQVKSIVNSRYNKSIIYSNTLGSEIDTGLVSLNNINSLLDILEPDEEIEFRLADNSFKTITIGELKEIKKEIIKAGQELYKTKWGLEKQIDGLSPEDVELAEIDFDNKQIIIKEEIKI